MLYLKKNQFPAEWKLEIKPENEKHYFTILDMTYWIGPIVRGQIYSGLTHPIIVWFCPLYFVGELSVVVKTSQPVFTQI